MDYANGSDSNSGLNPSVGFKTIQGAYNSLKTYAEAHYTAMSGVLGVGRVVLLPGDHDVGAGLTINNQRPCELVGFRAGENDYYVANSGARIVSSSAGVAAFVTVSGSSSGHGMRFRDLHFQTDDSVSTSLTKIISLGGCDNVHVDHCSFVNVHGSTPTLTNAIAAIYQASGAPADSAWLRIRDCESTGMQFYYCTGVNFNRCIIESGVHFNSGSNATIHLAGDFLGGSISFNNLEGSATAIKVDTAEASADYIQFIGNGGESPNSTNPFYDIVGGSNGCHFIGGYCNCADGTIGTWIRFGTGAYNNSVYGPYTYVGTAGQKRKIVDSSTGGWNTICHPNWGAPIRRFTAALVTDASFTPANPPDGTQAVTDNAGTRKMWVRSGGAWYSTVVT